MFLKMTRILWEGNENTMLPSHQLFFIVLSVFQKEIPKGTTKVINILPLINLFIQKGTIQHIHSNIL